MTDDKSLQQIDNILTSFNNILGTLSNNINLVYLIFGVIVIVVGYFFIKLILHFFKERKYDKLFLRCLNSLENNTKHIERNTTILELIENNLKGGK